MKLDERTVNWIEICISNAVACRKDFETKRDIIREELKKLNLVVKPGDSSQSVLVDVREVL